jgi:N utilization substance protein B
MALTSRTEARRLVLQALYAAETGDGSDRDCLEGLLDDGKPDERSLQFARVLYDLTRRERSWADESISGLAHNWKLERIALIDQIILRMAMAEIREMPDTPVKVVLNEAIELAKRFSTAESSSFINGILDSFIKNLPEITGV